MSFIYKQHSRWEPEFNPAYCFASVFDNMRSHQCQRDKNLKADSDGNLWCWQHHPDYVQKKRDDEKARWHKEDVIKKKRWRRSAAEKAACDGVPTDVLETIKVKDLLNPPAEAALPSAPGS